MRIAFLLAVLAGAAPAAALDFDVTAADDRPDAGPGDGVCDAGGGVCTLRAAVQEANASAGADTIRVPAGLYRLTVRGAAEDGAASGDLDLTDTVTITGAGPTVTVVDGRKAKDRVFDVYAGAALSGLTIQKGRVPKDDTGERGGGCLRTSSTLEVSSAAFTRCKSSEDAGALDAQNAAVTLTDVLFTRNKTRDDGGAVDVDGGTATLLRVTFERNKAGDEGGALESSGGVVDLTQVTMTRNKARSEGGAISNEDAGVMSLVDCTLTRNKAREGGAISVSDEDFGPNPTTVSGTTLSGNKKRNCSGTLIDGGGNTDSDGSCL